MKITLLEDEFSLRNNIKEFLELNNYIIDEYADGSELLEKCSFDSDIYILDVNVPGSNGFEVIQWILNNTPNSPVIFITAYTDIDSISKAYSLGCSDYLKKPFDLMELLLRVKKLTSQDSMNSIKILPNYIFDMQSKQLHRNSELIKLSKTQKEILYMLIKNKNELVTYDMLINYVWADKYIKHNTIASHIREIRNIAPELNILSYRAEGYVLKF